jgi:hypothetical protein
MASERTDLEPLKPNIAQQIGKQVIDLVSRIPKPNEKADADPETRAKAVISSAALKAAAAAGTLALPPGPVGWATILPEIYGIWRIQAQMIADVAALYGETAQLTHETMVYCLFRHSASQVARDVAVRVGERVIVKRVTLRAMQRLAQTIGIKVTQTFLRKAIVRGIPVLASLAAAGYAHWDTTQVGRTTVEYFEGLVKTAKTARKVATSKSRARTVSKVKAKSRRRTT